MDSVKFYYSIGEEVNFKERFYKNMLVIILLSLIIRLIYFKVFLF